MFQVDLVTLDIIKNVMNQAELPSLGGTASGFSDGIYGIGLDYPNYHGNVFITEINASNFTKVWMGEVDNSGSPPIFYLNGAIDVNASNAEKIILFGIKHLVKTEQYFAFLTDKDFEVLEASDGSDELIFDSDWNPSSQKLVWGKGEDLDFITEAREKWWISSTDGTNAYFIKTWGKEEGAFIGERIDVPTPTTWRGGNLYSFSDAVMFLVGLSDTNNPVNPIILGFTDQKSYSFFNGDLNKIGERFKCKSVYFKEDFPISQCKDLQRARLRIYENDFDNIISFVKDLGRYGVLTSENELYIVESDSKLEIKDGVDVAYMLDIDMVGGSIV